ncbi:winged helix-turn-helix domain-containing protein [Serratia fonticola]|uniref:Winged helix-turn-helix domain-containing protein n=1 Tax=Serratia fonticola TaxID=47917 RepID=A0AAJ2DDK2_SERFO|nr:winged helix-turn-helix domain-containing protein [Serratia fonticola]MDQ9129896.1 winged helix-turn-helix domain-containing protein [Serratia fonticola]
MEKQTLYGYLIGCDVYVDVHNKRLVYISTEKKKDSPRVIYLRETMMRLLIYILGHAQSHIVSDEDIMINVWDAQGLSSSSQRLWQVINKLSKKLNSLDVSPDFILRVKNQGYAINKEIITLLYCKKMEPGVDKRK